MSQDFKSFIGNKSKYFEDSIETGRFLDFATVTGSPYGSQIEGLDSSHCPTIFTIFRSGEFELMAKMGLQLPQILHAEQAYEYFEVLKPDQKIRYQTELKDVHRKEGKAGALHFMTFETAIERTVDKVVLAVACSTMVYREKQS